MTLDSARGETKVVRLISVIIPARDAANELAHQLEALAGQTYEGPWELIVADNGSRDDTAEVAERWATRFKSFRIVDASARKGMNYARNLGAQVAKGDFLMYCDADDVADPGWLAAMASAARSCDVLGGHLDVTRLNNLMAWRGQVSGTTNGLPTAGFLKYAIAANCGIRREVLDELGGWNEDYVRAGTEVSLFWRAQLASHELCFVPDAVMHYRYRADAKKLAGQCYQRGIASAHLYRDFRDRGFRRIAPLQIAKAWVWLAVHLPDLFVASRRRIWIKLAAFRLGRLRGSVRYRVVWL